MGSNSICSEGAFAIADQLLHNAQLRELHVENNLISILGLNSIFQALAITNRSLKYLDISGNFISVESLHAIRNLIDKS